MKKVQQSICSEANKTRLYSLYLVAPSCEYPLLLPPTAIAVNRDVFLLKNALLNQEYESQFIEPCLCSDSRVSKVQ